MRPTRRPPAAWAIVGLMLLGGACATDGPADDAADDVAAPTPASSTTPTTEIAAGTTTASPPAGFACETLEASATGNVARVELTEASGLVASSSEPGVLWSHNDSGDGATVYAVGLDGRDLGRVELVAGGEPVPAVDIEDVAIVDNAIWLADVGDNLAGRTSVSLHRFAEPAVSPDGPPIDVTVEVDRSVELRYDTGPTDAEAVLVDPISGDLLVLGKDVDDPEAPTELYLVDGPALTGEEPGPLTLRPAAALDVAAMTATSRRFSIGAMLYPGAVTGADITPSGDLIALRTYGAVWLFDRRPGQTVIEALGGPPCEVGAPAETQGESIAFLPTVPGDGPGEVLVATIGEGDAQPVNVTRVRITR